MGEGAVSKGRDVFDAGRIPNYRFPESAVDAFLRIWSYTRDLKLLYETPPAIPNDFAPDTETVRNLIRELQQDHGRRLMSEMESRQVLAAYQIPVTRANSAAMQGRPSRMPKRSAIP